MWLGGLISALRLLMEHGREPEAVRIRLLRLQSGFLLFTALPGLLICCFTTAISAFAFHRAQTLGGSWQALWPPDALYLGISAVHALTVVRYSWFAALPPGLQSTDFKFRLYHKIVQVLALLLLISK